MFDLFLQTNGFMRYINPRAVVVPMDLNDVDANT